MLPAEAAAMAMSDLTDLKDHFSVEDALWTSCTREAGDPGTDIRLFAALPP